MTEHLRHAEAFLVVDPPATALDLGSGGGIPGLPLALTWPDCQWTLLDANERRTAFLEQVVAELGLEDHVRVRRDRAEVAAHDPSLRHHFELVVARGFGPPAVTAECSAAFLQVNGRLLVSEPPEEDPTRWSSAGLESVGLVDEGAHGTVRRLRQRALPSASVPRRTGIPGKRPLW